MPRSPATWPSRLDAVRDDPAAGHAVGVEYATAMAERLLAEGAPGLHYITLNRSTATLEIHRNVLNSRSAQHVLAAHR